MTKDELIAFEADIAECFNQGMIRAPIHLDNGNEDALLDIFKQIKPQDWVCGAWRMHYKCLLKGVSPEQLKADILAGRSITLTYPEYRIISSAIVGGICPIALGLAWAAKHNGSGERVYCFVGDMTAMTGIFHECRCYAERQELPLTFIIEDNGLSVCTPTKEVWGPRSKNAWANVIRFNYHLGFPHSGAGKRVEF
jgi:TPP-dependent pyruvate/acetoin dehydrogenase alpha subunit